MPDPPPDQSLTRHSLEELPRPQIAAWLIVLSLLMAAAAWLRMFADFVAADDEGTLMINVRQYLGGMKLYRELFTVYGPVYYLYSRILRMVTGTPVTHDVTRMSALIPLLAGAFLCAWIVWRLTDSFVLSALTQLFAARAMTFVFRVSPGHPQELAVLLLFLFAALPLCRRNLRWQGWVMVCSGATAAALLLIKINIGLFAIATLLLAIVLQLPRNKLIRWSGIAVAGGCVLLPLALMRSHFEYQWAQVYCWLETLSIASVGLCLINLRTNPTVTVRDVRLALAGMAAAIAIVLSTLQFQGVTPAVVWNALVLDPIRIYLGIRDWFLDPQFPPLTAIWAAAGFAGAALTAWVKPVPGSNAARKVSLVKAAFSLIGLLVAISSNQSALTTFVIPFSWLVLFNPRQEQVDAQAYPRAVLCVLSVMQTMYAFPVAGTQSTLIQILPFTVVAVCAGDSFVRTGRAKILSRYRRQIATVMLAGIAIFEVVSCRTRYREYMEMPSLDLPGASLIHVSVNDSHDLHWVTQNLKEYCDAYEGLPGVPSFGFWTGEYPLTGQNLDSWLAIFSDRQQEIVIDALAGHPRACIVYNPALVKLWNRGHRDVEALPLVRYIRQNFRIVGNSGDYYLMVRRERESTFRTEREPSTGPSDPRE